MTKCFFLVCVSGIKITKTFTYLFKKICKEMTILQTR